MKKKNLKGLRLKKEKISSFRISFIKGGTLGISRFGEVCTKAGDICFRSGDIECDWSLGQDDWDNHPTLGLCQ